MGVNPTTNQMANVRLKSSVYFDGQTIRVIKSSSGLSPEINTSTTPFPVIPATGNAAQFEMLISPIGGSTGNIVRNDASNWTPLDGVKYVEHILDVADTSPAGTYSNDVTYNIQVRKISNPIDSVSGNITTINRLVVTNGGGGSIGDTPDNPIVLSAIYNGLDQDTGLAEVLIQYAADKLNLISRIRGPQTNNQFQTTTEQIDWSNSTYTGTITDYAIQTSLFSGDSLQVLNFTNLTQMQSGTNLIASSFTAGTTDVKYSIIKIDIFRINVPGALYSKYFALFPQAYN